MEPCVSGENQEPPRLPRLSVNPTIPGACGWRRNHGATGMRMGAIISQVVQSGPLYLRFPRRIVIPGGRIRQVGRPDQGASSKTLGWLGTTRQPGQLVLFCRVTLVMRVAGIPPTMTVKAAVR